MVRKDGAEARKKRIQLIGVFIQRKLFEDKEIFLSKNVAALQYEYGLTKLKIMEYLGILEAIGQFVIDEENDKIRKITES
ncbi:hypothetical protein KAU92_00835 [Candidatus Bathyarchaeota archaeon]|nr:hypothetical protein [Candidatus Bathyarchaeota archaeon]